MANTSLPVRGAWVEISIICSDIAKYLSRSPCGERGLKYGESEKAKEFSVAPRAGSVG